MRALSSSVTFNCLSNATMRVITHDNSFFYFIILCKYLIFRAEFVNVHRFIYAFSFFYIISCTFQELASTGDLIFTDEVEAVKREAEILNEQGVDIIIVLSHCGLDIDR